MVEAEVRKMKRTGGTFEAGARPGPSELVVSMLSPKCIDPQHVAGGSPSALKPSEYAGMLAGIEHADRWLALAAVAVFEGKYLDQGSRRVDLINMLHLWGGQRCLFRHASIEISGEDHQDLAMLVVAQFCSAQALTFDTARAALRIGHEKWKRWQPIVADLESRLTQAEALLADHLWAQIKNREIKLAPS